MLLFLLIFIHRLEAYGNRYFRDLLRSGIFLGEPECSKSIRMWRQSTSFKMAALASLMLKSRAGMKYLDKVEFLLSSLDCWKFQEDAWTVFLY